MRAGGEGAGAAGRSTECVRRSRRGTAATGTEPASRIRSGAPAPAPAQ